MKTLFLGIALTLFWGTFSPVAAQAAETVRVQVNREKRAPRSGIRIRFVRLIEDSRCPADVQCIHAGNARVSVRVTARNGRSQVLELSTQGASQDARFGGYRFELVRLTPEPRSNIRVNPNGYVATISVTR